MKDKLFFVLDIVDIFLKYFYKKIILQLNKIQKKIYQLLKVFLKKTNKIKESIYKFSCKFRDGIKDWFKKKFCNPMYNKIFYLIHHFARPIYALYVYRILFFVFHFFLLLFNPKKMKLYIKIKREWESIKNVKELIVFFKKYNYKWKKYNNKDMDWERSKLEFFFNSDKSNTIGKFSTIKLKELGYKVKRIGIVSRTKIETWHYDSIYKKDSNYVLFNGGSLIINNSINNCIERLGIKYEKFWGKDISYWICNKTLEYICGGVFLSLFAFLILVIFMIL